MKIGRFRYAAAVALGMAGIAAPAAAEWLEATSAHFRIVADSSEKEVREQALDLERFDLTLRRLQGVPDSDGVRANKVTVYVLPNLAAIKQLCRCENTAGLYFGRVDGAVAFTPRRSGDRGFNALRPQTVLLHEYTHHFLLGSFPLAFPAWFSEGFAEFMSTATFKNGEAWIGQAAQHRAGTLLRGPTLSTADLVSADLRSPNSTDRVAAIYARGWLLTHYLSVDRERYAMLRRYIGALNEGTPSRAAAEATFGDLAALDVALASYLRKPLPGLVVPGIAVPDDAIAVRKLSPGEAALAPLRIRSAYRVTRATGAVLFAEAAPIAARFPADAVAQGWLAEMALDAGRPADAIAAADRALAVEPDQVQALLHKAWALTYDRSADAAARAEARRLIVRANRVDADAARPLWMYYRNFLATGEQPTPAAITGLYRAAELVPQDRNVRLTAARQRLRDGDTAAARALLAPLAFAPHGARNNPAALLVAAIDAGAPAAEILRGPAPPADPKAAPEPQSPPTP